VGRFPSWGPTVKKARREVHRTPDSGANAYRPTGPEKKKAPARDECLLGASENRFFSDFGPSYSPSSVVVATTSSSVVDPSFIRSIPDRLRVHIPSFAAWSRMAFSSTFSPALRMIVRISFVK
jgi:hypothetical protein